MCGICGALSAQGPLVLPEGTPERMIGIMSHRGPDEFGAWRDELAFLGHARLSIIDLGSGQQPLGNETGQIWITFNGEIFNYPELRQELTSLGHTFRTRSDTETIVHAYEQWGHQCVERFNGQFAFAIWDQAARRLFLARDRYGIRPLYLTWHEGKLLFASEIKALLAWPGVQARLDPGAVAEVCTYWVNILSGTCFDRIVQLPPGHVAKLELSGDTDWAGSAAWDATLPTLPDSVKVHRYWQPTFLPEAEDRRFVSQQEKKVFAGQVREALIAAATIRLRADVPVGAYLSGGLDSSTTAALIHRYTDHHLKTFSVGFADPAYDESAWQYEMAGRLGTEHRLVSVDGEDIASHFPSVVWHAEIPLLRAAPVPLYALSQLVRGENYKVVLTGEGADEVFVGYNIFREAKVRRFWSRAPGSRTRSLLLGRLYPYLAQSPPEFLRRFYGMGLDQPTEAFFSHRTRWSNTGMITAFLLPEATTARAAREPEARLASALPADFARWGIVARAQCLEMTTFLAGYLLSSQGDRMLMGHSVEGRFPFLDHNVGALAAAIPASIKLESLREKSILKQSVADLLPAGILNRPKQPYRAPDGASFHGPVGSRLVDRLTDPVALGESGLWHADRVLALVRKWRARRLTSARENMALMAVLSTQLLWNQFGPELSGRIQAAALLPGQLSWRQPSQGRAAGRQHGP